MSKGLNEVIYQVLTQCLAHRTCSVKGEPGGDSGSAGDVREGFVKVEVGGQGVEAALG